MTPAQQRCKYSHDVSAFNDFEGGEWHCPYEEHSDGLCLFHLPVSEKSDDAVKDALLKAIRDQAACRVPNTDDERINPPQKTFFGSRFGELELSHILLNPDDNHPIDFRDCDFEGALQCSYFEARSPLWFDDAVMQGPVTFDEALFEKEVRFDDTIFRNDVSFFDAKFNADAHFTDATFESFATFYAAAFREDGKFTDTRFQGNVKFSQVSFDGNAQFGRSVFRSRVRFDNTRFRSNALFDDARLDYISSFRHATFGDNTRFNGTRFFGETVFSEVNFDGTLSLIGVTVSHAMIFDDTTFARGVTLSGELKGNLSLNHARFKDRVETKNLSTDIQRTVSLRNSAIAEGELVCSSVSGTSIKYDLRNATVGKVDLTGTERLEKPVFHNLRFEQTEFNGFEFADYIDEFTETNWLVHTTHEDNQQSSYWSRLLIPCVFHTPFELAGSGLSAAERAARFSTYEGTYLRAKNGAKRVGYSRAAADFFIRELSYRRRKSFWQIFTDGRPAPLRAIYKWGANLTLAIASGYGERPSYVIFLSAILIVGFSVVYSTVAPGLYPDMAPFLSLSIGSFVTLLFGNPGPITNFPIVSVLAHLEGIIGAFLIALFVFTLTRSLHR